MTAKHEQEMAAFRDDRKWHLEKTISVSHIFTTVAAIASIVVFGSKMDTRVTVIEQAAISQRAVDVKQDSDAMDFKRLVREDLKDLGVKMDKVIDKVSAQK